MAVFILCKSEIGVHGDMTESGQVPDSRSINIVLDSWRKNKFLCLKGKIFAKVTQIIEECPDCYAWIRIPDTNIDYPIVQSPSDNTFYLDHNSYGDYEYAGAIFTENLNAKDFTDPNTVIYGHNMKNGSMFQNLHLFEDRAFMEEHPTFEIYLPDKILTYQVFAAYNYDDRHLLQSFDFKDSRLFELYLEEIRNQRSMSANIDAEVAVTAEDKIVTLSTCNGINDQRYLVQGVLLSEQKVTVN